MKKLSRKSRVGIIILTVLLSLAAGAWALWQAINYYLVWDMSIRGFNRYTKDFQVMADIILEHEDEINQQEYPWLHSGSSGLPSNDAYIKIQNGAYLPLTDIEKEHVKKANEAYHAATDHDMDGIALKENEIWFGSEGRGYCVVYTKDGKRPDYSKYTSKNREVSIRKYSSHWYGIMID